MAIFGRVDFLPPQQRDSLHELAGVRGFDGEFEKSLYIKGIETRDLTPGSPGALFLESARMQQQVARLRPEYWAAVHATGFGEKGPFAVFDHYPRTAADLVKAGTGLIGEELQRIIMSVLKGLRDLQQLTGRPHGNINPSNVLIGAGELEEAGMALSDPAPTNHLALGEAKNDLFQVGQLIHELVLHQPFGGSWPVAASGGWSDLGRDGRRWRNLCNRLLHPNPEKRPQRLATVYNKVAGLGRRRALLLRPVPLLLLMIGIGAVVFMQWDRISSWTAAHLPRRETATTQPAEPAPTNPQHLAVVPATADAPTTQPGATLAADAAFLADYQALYERRSWAAPAQYLANLRGRLASTSSSDSAARKAMGDIEAMLKKIEARWSALRETSDFLHQRAQNDPVLLTYPQFLRQSIAPIISRPATASPLPALLEALDSAGANAAWNAVIVFLKSPEAQNLDHPWLIESSPLHKRFGNKALASSDDLRAWMAYAKHSDFQRLASSDDPRARWSPRQQIKRLAANDLQRLASLYKDPAEAKAATAQFNEKLDAIDKSAAALLASDLPWSTKNRPAITTSMGEVDQQIASMAEQIRGAIAKQQAELDRMAAAARQRQEALQFVARLESVKLSAIPAVQREWQARSRPLVDDMRADPARLRAELSDRALGLQRRLEAVDVAFASLPQKLEIKAAASPAPWNDRLTGALQTVDMKQREKFLEDLLAATRAAANREPTLDEVKARAAELRRNYDQWTVAAGKMVADLSEADRLLAGGYSLDERPGPGLPSARQLLEQWQRQEFFESEPIQSAIQPLIGPIGQLERADWQTLLRMSGDADLRGGLRLTAWRNLTGADAPWPAKREDVTQAMGVAQSLAAAVRKSAPDESRRELQLSEVNRGTAKLWARFVSRAKAAEDITFALSLREKLAIPAELIDERTRFNIALQDARAAVAQSPDEKARAEALARISGSLQTAIDALPKALRDNPEVARLAEALRQRRIGTAGVDFSTLGPMAAKSGGGSLIRWDSKWDEQTGTVTYSARVKPEITADALEIVFKRLEMEGGDVYLSTTEVPVGLFADLISAAEKWRDVAPKLWSYDPRDGDPRPGPRSWEWPRYGRATQGIWRTKVWLAGGNSDHYPETLATVENRMVLRDKSGGPALELNPSKRQPMQYVSPEAAIYFCQMLGCRLPTSGEWKTAYRLYAKDSWNLRDRTFRILQRWTYNASTADRFMPDLGIFTPGGEKQTPEIWTEGKLFNREGGSADREYDDRVLWFREVAPGGAQNFNHLVGNVAEMVYENGRLYTIGGSALSPPSRAIDQAFEIPNRVGNKGYSDIGFRLAFSAPPSPSQNLLAILEKQQYLLP